MSLNVDQEWITFLEKNSSNQLLPNSNVSPHPKSNDADCGAIIVSKTLSEQYRPALLSDVSDYGLNISTKTKILFLNRPVDINSVFWEIPITEYWKSKPGIVKKQMKFMSKTSEELLAYKLRLSEIPFYAETILKQIDNPKARSVKFKDERNLTVGISTRDILNPNRKSKNAFYNCFAVIVRVLFNGKFHELHVKVFNTGKMEIPGVVSAEVFTMVKDLILSTLLSISEKGAPGSCAQLRANSILEIEEAAAEPIKSVDLPTEDSGRQVRASAEPGLGDHLARDPMDMNLRFMNNTEDRNILINSNFNCGYCIDRDALYEILKSDKYQIEAAYDPCSYPGVKCRFYFNHELGVDSELQNGRVVKNDRTLKIHELGDMIKYTEVSFMLFRTGSGLIVGNCTDAVLMFIFGFVKRVLDVERAHICAPTPKVLKKLHIVKIRKKKISMTTQFFEKTYGVSSS